MTGLPIDIPETDQGASDGLHETAKPKNSKPLPKAPSKPWLRPVCFLAGHKTVPAEGKPGWFKNDCGRCGLDVHRPWFRRIRSIPWRTERALVWLANQIARRNNYPGAYWPVYRHIDQQIIGIGTKHSCAAYSYEHLQSMIEQYKGDGLPVPTLEEFLSEDGWIDLEEHPEEIQPMLDEISKGVELLRTKQEQEELNRYDD